MTTNVTDPGDAGLPPLVAPGGRGGFRDVFRERYLLRLLVRKEIRARYQGSVLGLLWSYVQPAAMFLAYYLIIGIVFELRDDIENFPIHIFAGMTMVHYFNETFASGTRSIVRNSGIISKMNLPREMFPVASMLVSAYHTFPQLLILLAAALAYGWDPGVYDVAAGLLGFSIVAVIGMALALLFSAANVFFRDFQNIVATVRIFVMWSTPMIYPFTLIEQKVAGSWVLELYLANPIANGVILMQQLFWVPTVDGGAVMPDHLLTRGAIVLLGCLLFLAAAQWVFSRLEGKFAERL